MGVFIYLYLYFIAMSIIDLALMLSYGVLTAP